MSGMTLRDHFAAAALAGMLSRNNFVGERDQCRAAYLWADAMLAARASEATASPERVRVRGDAGTGDTQEPVAWATFCPNGSTASVYVGRQPQHAEPLYRKPTLTDAEREAVSVAYGMMNERAAKLQERPDTREAARPFIQWARALQGLFERLGGEK
jgi:hypothetical protein